MREEIRDHKLEQHTGTMARRNVTCTDVDMDNIAAQTLGLDVGKTSLPNNEDMVTSVGLIMDIPPFQIAHAPTIVGTPTISTTIGIVNTTTVTDLLRAIKEEAPP